MILGITMIILAVAVIVGTSIYLKHIDARLAAGRSGDTAPPGLGAKGVTARSKRSQGKGAVTTENMWGIENVRHGVVISFGGWYAMILKLGSIDFHMMNEGEQSAVESALMAAAMAIDYHLTFFSTVELCDTRSCALAIRDALYSEDFQQGSMTDYAISMYEFLDSMMQNRSIHNRSRYIIVFYHTLGGYDGARQELLRTVQVVQNSLLRAKINADLLSSEQVVDVFFRFCNRGRMFKPSDAVAAGAMDYYATGKGAHVNEA